MPPATVLQWIGTWDIREVSTKATYNTMALVRWKRLFKFLYTAVIFARDPSAALIFHNGRRQGQDIEQQRLEDDRDQQLPRRMLPLQSMIKGELQEEMDINGLEYQGMTCREMRVVLKEQRIENGQCRRSRKSQDPELKGLNKMKKSELVQLAARRGIKEVKPDMLKDKILCLILGQDPTAIKRRRPSWRTRVSHLRPRGLFRVTADVLPAGSPRAQGSPAQSYRPPRTTPRTRRRRRPTGRSAARALRPKT